MTCIAPSGRGRCAATSTRVRVGKVVQHARADDLVECLAELSDALDREPMETQIVEVMLRSKARVWRKLVSLMSIPVTCASGSARAYRAACDVPHPATRIPRIGARLGSSGQRSSEGRRRRSGSPGLDRRRRRRGWLRAPGRDARSSDGRVPSASSPLVRNSSLSSWPAKRVATFRRSCQASTVAGAPPRSDGRSDRASTIDGYIRDSS